MSIEITVNNQLREVDASADTPLLWVLRDHLQMTGTRFGCGMAQCGACTVHLDGKPVRSCVTAISSVGNKKVTTIEAVGKSAVSTAVQNAWTELNVAQCGYCQSGQVMSAIGLLESNARPSDDDINTAMNGNICRCSTYVRIRAAIKKAATTLA